MIWQRIFLESKDREDVLINKKTFGVEPRLNQTSNYNATLDQKDYYRHFLFYFFFFVLLVNLIIVAWFDVTTDVQNTRITNPLNKNYFTKRLPLNTFCQISILNIFQFIEF